MKKLSTIGAVSSLVVVALVATSASVAQATGGGGNGSGKGMRGKNQQQSQSIQPTVSQTQKDSASYMLEEEKMAHDLYGAFYNKWGTSIFNNISTSETKHQQAVSRLVTSFGTTASVADKQGVFTNKEIQALYTKLYEKGMVSQKDALEVGKIVEETDIADLKEATLNSTTEQEKTIYNQLLRGSNNHLKAFNRLLN